MGRLYPEYLPRAELAPGIARELDTLTLLKAKLPATHSIFHGVHWTKGWAHTPAFGEADFIVVNAAGMCLVIEQKCGPLLEGTGGLAKRYGDEVKSVTSQLHRTLDALRDKFRRQMQARLGVDYLLYCPDHRVKNVNAAGLDRERIVDADAAGRLHERILTLLPDEAPDPQGAAVHRFLHQTLDLIPDIHSRVRASDQCYTRAVGGLAEIVSAISGHPLRLAVRGTAGCGKSLVAMKAFQTYVARGKRPLLLCFNRDLKEKMKANAGAGGVVETFHGAIASVLEATGRPLQHDGQVDWNRAADMVLEGEVPHSWKFDAVIVDEGQDFEPGWRDMLDLFGADGADRIWLDDPDQAIQYGLAPDTGTWPQPGWTGYHAKANFRSPVSIARYIRTLLPEFEFEIANPLPGLGVRIIEVDDRDAIGAAVGKWAAEVIGTGLPPERMVALSLRGQASATLANQGKAGPHSIARFTGEYDLFGNQQWTKGKLRFDTIRRYKGQQDAAVILTDIEAPEDPAREAEWRRLMFAALTRATERLDLVVKKGSPTAKMLKAAL